MEEVGKEGDEWEGVLRGLEYLLRGEGDFRGRMARGEGRRGLGRGGSGGVGGFSGGGLGFSGGGMVV